jgi:hypothetical protein
MVSSPVQDVPVLAGAVVVTRVQRYMEIYSCGPDGHCAVPGERALANCVHCDKLLGAEICVFCGHFGQFRQGRVPLVSLAHADGRRASGALCGPCHLDLRDNPDLGWRLVSLDC